MLRIPLLLTFSSFLLAQSLYSMEKETKEHKTKFSLSLRKKSADTSSPKETPRCNTNNETSIPLISFTTTSESASADIETSRSQLSKPKPYTRSKTVDSSSTQPKDKIKIFSSSDGTIPKISPRAMLASSLKNLSQAKTVPQEKINILTNAVKNYDLPTIEEYVNNPQADLNQIDQWGNTALHHAVIKLTETINNEAMLKKIITLFLHDVRTDTSITNIYGNRAVQILSGGDNLNIRMLSGKDDLNIRTLLFAKGSLDERTNHEIGKMLLEIYLNNLDLTDDLIKQTVECIKKKIRSTETKKGKNSINLPQEATLPDYATDEFIIRMIKYRIPEESYYVSELQKTILKDIFIKEKNIILLNVSIDINEKSISESLDNILNTMKKSHNYLTRFVNKTCIFEILETYYLKNAPSHFINFCSEKNITDQAPMSDVSQCKKSKKPSDFLHLYTTDNTNEKTLSIRQFICDDSNLI